MGMGDEEDRLGREDTRSRVDVHRRAQDSPLPGALNLSDNELRLAAIAANRQRRIPSVARCDHGSPYAPLITRAQPRGRRLPHDRRTPQRGRRAMNKIVDTCHYQPAQHDSDQTAPVSTLRARRRSFAGPIGGSGTDVSLLAGASQRAHAQSVLHAAPTI